MDSEEPARSTRTKSARGAKLGNFREVLSRLFEGRVGLAGARHGFVMKHYVFLAPTPLVLRHALPGIWGARVPPRDAERPRCVTGELPQWFSTLFGSRVG